MSTDSRVTPFEVDALNLAREFHARVRKALTPDRLKRVDAQNRSPDFPDGCCATHDFTDANVLMDEAFIKVFERAPELDEDAEGGRADVALWEAAWDKARAVGFAKEWK